MPIIRFNRNGFGTRKQKDRDWFLGNPIKSVEKYLQEYQKSLNYIESKEGLENAYKDLLSSFEKKDKFIKAKIAALRIATLRKADDLDLDTRDVDIDYENKLQNVLEEKDIRLVTTGERPQETRGEKRLRKDEDEEDEIKKQPRIEIQKDDEETKEMDVEEEEKKLKRKRLEPIDNADEGEESIFIDQDQSQAQVPDQDDVQAEENLDQSTPNQEQNEELANEEEEEKESLKEIELTHPDQIVETERPFVQDPVEKVVTETEALPDDVIPQGQDVDDDEKETMMPNDFNQQQQDLAKQDQQNENDLPDYEDINSDYEDDVIEKGETKPYSYLGFDNAGMAVTITHKPTSNEVQDLYISAISKVVDNTINMDVDDPIQLEEIVQSILSPDIEEEEEKVNDNLSRQDETNVIEKTKDKENVKDVDQNMDIEETSDRQDYQVEENVEMSEPSASQLRAQEKERKEILRQEKIRQKKEEKEKLKKQKHDEAMEKIHSEIFGQKPIPIITDEDEAKQYTESMKLKKNRVLQYVNNIVTSSIKRIMDEKTEMVGQIKSGHAKSEFSLKATDRPATEEQKEIRKSVIQQEIRDTIEAKQLQRTSDILAEVGDFTIKNIQRIQENINPRFAISKYIYPTYRDPDTYNIVKYRSDADGNVIIDKRTGHPIIESISAVDRDDTRKLLEQKKAVDSTDTPCPYFPIYGKPARRYFSKLEYNYLGRMFQGPGGKHRGSIPKPNNLKARVKELLKEMSSSLELKETNIKEKDLFKQWMELEVLKSSYQRYNQFSDYQYVQDKRELGEDGTLTDPDAMESAGKLLQNITVQKLLDLLAQQKRKELEELPNTEDRLPVTLSDLKDKQQEAEIGQDEMDISKEPKDIGAEVPQEEETKESEIDLGTWAKKVDSQYQLQTPQVYRNKPFPAFGGDLDNLKDL